jgi:hypothetical protein
MSVLQMARLERGELLQDFFVSFPGIGLLRLDHEKVIRRAPAVNDHVRHNDLAIGLLNLVTITVVLRVDVPARELLSQMIGEPRGDGALVDVPDQQAGVLNKQIVESRAHPSREWHVGCTSDQEVLPTLPTSISAHNSFSWLPNS